MPTTYRVTGMTCDHCAATIARTVRELPGVEHVLVDRPNATLTLEGSVPPDAVRAAVQDAGYDLEV